MQTKAYKLLIEDTRTQNVIDQDATTKYARTKDAQSKEVFSQNDLIALDEEFLTAIAGGKALGLVRLLKAGGGRFKVPPFFVIRAGADFNNALSRQSLIKQVSEAIAELEIQYDQSPKNKTITFAVRSSCLCEDQKNGSFAGQFDSYLSLVAGDVFAKIEAVVDGANGANVDRYKKLMRIAGGRNEMAVLVQVMIEPQVAGVMFSADPINAEGGAGANGTVVINAVEGLADKLVQGLEDGEHITVRGSQIKRNGASPIGEVELLELASQARELEELFRFAVDVEWAVRDQTVYILQVRPITTMTMESGDARRSAVALPEQGFLRVFDGSNIQESYPGITSPMTFSFVRRAYREVYRSFVRLMGVSDKVIGQNEDIFASMLGFIDGHVYYNLGSWYRLLALLPAYKTNRGFMEKMMGLKEPALAVSPDGDQSLASSFTEKIATIFALVHIGREYLQLEQSKANFYRRLDKALDIDRATFKTLDMDGLCRLYRSLEMDLLTKWDAPIVNDFFAMIVFGIYQKLNGDAASYHSLIEGLGNVISARPPKMIQEMAELIKDDRTLVTAMLKNPNLQYVDKLFQSHHRAYALYQDYLRQFGDRSIGELKLESQSVRENPALLLSTIAAAAGACVRSRKTGLSVVRKCEQYPQSQKLPKTHAHTEVKTSFPQSLFKPTASVKRLLLSLISEHTRHLIAGRENLRFARTGVFGLVRDIMLSLADKLVAQNLLDHRQDIFYLEVEEVLGFVEGSSTCKNLRALVALRKAEEMSYLRVIPDRVACTGPVGLVSMLSAAQQEKLSSQSLAPTESNKTLSQIKGLPACSGKILGLARVIKDPACEHLLPGEILVAERTDPGWIMHFALCQGIVTSYGSMLSHTAIVARELKIPAVVGAKGATEIIGTGDLIEVDGATGLVTIIRRAAQEGSLAVAAKDCA